MKKLLLLVSVLCYTLIVQAQVSNSNDPTFNTYDPDFGKGGNTNSMVYKTCMQSDGKVIVVGDFTEYDDKTQNRIVRLKADGWIDVSFNTGTGADGAIRSAIAQTDGKIIIVGEFKMFNGKTFSGITRLNADGSIDTAFKPGSAASGFGTAVSVKAVSLQSDGKILIAGSFEKYNGTDRNRIARLNMDGTLDTSFNPGSGVFSDINAVALQSDGKIIIGGDFSLYNGTVINRIARLNSNGTLDTSFNPGTGANNSIYSIVVQPDGKLIVGGDFTSFNNITKNRIVRLNSNGTIDTSFNSGTGADSTIRSISLQENGKIIIGGFFFYYNDNWQKFIASLNADGSLDTTFNQGEGPGDEVLSTMVQPSGKIIIAGKFGSYNTITRNKIARLTSNGLLDDSANAGTGANGNISSIALQANGKIMIAGYFYQYNEKGRGSIARLNANGSLDSTFDPGKGTGGIDVIAMQPDGKSIISGYLQSYNGAPCKYIARVNTDGSLDTSFDPAVGWNGMAKSICFQPDGKIIVGGLFSQVLARLNPDGSLDTTFNVGAAPSGGVYAVILQPDGKIVIGGYFTKYNNLPRYKMARINADGSLDDSFNPFIGVEEFVNSSILVDSMVLQPDGKIIICVGFTSPDGMKHERISRLNTDGSLDTTFNSGIGADYFVRSIIIQPNGKLLIVGEFLNYNNTEMKYIASLNADGSFDTFLNLGKGANKAIRSAAVQPDGKIILGGEFTMFDGQSRGNITRIFGASESSLSASQHDSAIVYNATVFPNPYSENFNLNINTLNDEIILVKVYDMLGKLLEQREIMLNEIEGQKLGNHYPSGIYNVVVTQGKETKTLKIIKK